MYTRDDGERAVFRAREEIYRALQGALDVKDRKLVIECRELLDKLYNRVRRRSL